MSKIKAAFSDKKALIGFLTAGDPTFEDSIKNIIALAEGGADIIEIGIPFSDPIAEGAVVQASNLRALENGMNVDRVFELAAEVRKITSVPIVLVTYLNPVFAYGYDEFFEKCADAGVNGIICPDLPFEEKAEVCEPASEHGVEVISLISPEAGNRVKMIVPESNGFLYVTTAANLADDMPKIKTDIASMMETVRECSDMPAAIALGIQTVEQAATIAKYADGVVLENALVAITAVHGKDAPKYIREFVEKVKAAM